MREAGIYRAMVAKRFGGNEMSPALPAPDRNDQPGRWLLGLGCELRLSAVYLSALPLPTLEKMYANGPDVIFAGGIYPPQRAVPVAGGLEVSGRWSWGSGSTGRT
jgi:hypothetical protein